MAISLDLVNVGKTFAERTVLEGINLSIKPGEFFSLVGPSGCGKSTLLRMVAGLEFPNKGQVLLNGEEATDLPPQERNVGMVFQHYALFPNMTVSQNVAFGLEVKRLPRAEIRTKVSQVLEKMNLLPLANKSVTLLSGGEQQRVSLARVLVTEPGLILFDEPLSNLDASMRIQARKEIQRLQREVGITALFVTHDQAEALAMSDRIAVLAQGRLQQCGTPEEIYRQPHNGFVAQFIGAANFFSPAVGYQLGLSNLDANSQLVVLPEDLSLVKDPSGLAKIVDRHYQGLFTEYVVQFENQEFRSRNLLSDDTYNIGDRVHLSIPRHHPVLLPEEVMLASGKSVN